MIRDPRQVASAVTPGSQRRKFGRYKQPACPNVSHGELPNWFECCGFEVLMRDFVIYSFM